MRDKIDSSAKYGLTFSLECNHNSAMAAQSYTVTLLRDVFYSNKTIKNVHKRCFRSLLLNIH